MNFGCYDCNILTQLGGIKKYTEKELPQLEKFDCGIEARYIRTLDRREMSLYVNNQIIDKADHVLATMTLDQIKMRYDLVFAKIIIANNTEKAYYVVIGDASTSHVVGTKGMIYTNGRLDSLDRIWATECTITEMNCQRQDVINHMISNKLEYLFILDKFYKSKTSGTTTSEYILLDTQYYIPKGDISKLSYNWIKNKIVEYDLMFLYDTSKRNHLKNEISKEFKIYFTDTDLNTYLNKVFGVTFDKNTFKYRDWTKGEAKSYPKIPKSIFKPYLTLIARLCYYEKTYGTRQIMAILAKQNGWIQQTPDSYIYENVEYSRNNLHNFINNCVGYFKDHPDEYYKILKTNKNTAVAANTSNIVTTNIEEDITSVNVKDKVEDDYLKIYIHLMKTKNEIEKQLTELKSAHPLLLEINLIN